MSLYAPESKFVVGLVGETPEVGTAVRQLENKGFASFMLSDFDDPQLAARESSRERIQSVVERVSDFIQAIRSDRFVIEGITQPEEVLTLREKLKKRGTQLRIFGVKDFPPEYLDQETQACLALADEVIDTEANNTPLKERIQTWIERVTPEGFMRGKER